MNNQVVTVNLVPGLSAPAVVRVSQYDYGRPIVFNILDGTQAATIDSSATITVVGTKPSGLGFSETALTISGGAVTLNTTSAMTQESGLIPAEIRIEEQGSGNIGTANFILAVEKTPHAEGTTDGTTETARTILEQAQAAADAAAASAEEVAHAGIDASTARNGQVPTADGNGSWSWQAQHGGGGGSVTVDSAMSSTSTNPVQNRVIYTALQDKADSSDLATVATSGSYNDLSNKPTIPSISGLQTQAITDAGGYFSTDTVEAALQQLGAELDGVATLLAAI